MLSRVQLEQLCPFCNRISISNGLITFSPERHFFALYNIRPVFPGHSLIVPVSHITKFTDIPVETVLEFYQFQKQIINALQQVYQTESYDMLMQEGEFSGQSIPHLHIHLLPRVEDDIPKEQEWMDFFQKHEHMGKLLSPGEMQVESEKIRSTYHANMSPTGRN